MVLKHLQLEHIYNTLRYLGTLIIVYKLLDAIYKKQTRFYDKKYTKQNKRHDIFSIITNKHKPVMHKNS